MAILFFGSRKQLSDSMIVVGLQEHSKTVERYFFDMLKRYFEAHFNQIFFDQDSKQEIFQSSIIKLWTEIENKTIKDIDGYLFRKDKRGMYQKMTASLTTFFMAFAKNDFRELLRSVKEDNLENLLQNAGDSATTDTDDSIEDNQIQAVDECLLSMSPNCIEIITLFYYKQKTLDEILSLRKDKNTSKDGLKTAKNKCMTTLKNRVNERFQLLQS